MDGIKPGASTVAVGSNYLNTTFNPGPGKYNCEGAFSPFYSEVLKNKDDDTSFFTVSNGGKLTRRTQWFSADRTKRFASDDPSHSQFIKPSKGPGDYSPRNELHHTISDKFEVKRFSEMDATSLKNTLASIKTAVSTRKDPSRKFKNNAPPGYKMEKIKMPPHASIPIDQVPYMNKENKTEEKRENKY